MVFLSHHSRGVNLLLVSGFFGETLAAPGHQAFFGETFDSPKIAGIAFRFQHLSGSEEFFCTPEFQFFLETRLYFCLQPPFF